MKLISESESVMSVKIISGENNEKLKENIGDRRKSAKIMASMAKWRNGENHHRGMAAKIIKIWRKLIIM
jgi:hypothetical protein